MEKLILSRTGLAVTRIGFGGIPIQRLPEEEAVAVVKGCLDLGVNFLESGRAYTISERCIGRAISGRRDGLVLVSKTARRGKEKAAADIKSSLEDLGVDYIDLCQLHNVSDMETYARVTGPGGALFALQEAKENGVIGHIGISCHTMEPAKRAVTSGLFETVQYALNFVATSAAKELLPLCREHGVDFIVMKPMGGGALEYPDVAIKYLMQFPDIAILLGVEKVAEMEEAVRIISGPREMNKEEKRRMAELARELGSKFCRRCDYCQPCTEGISISTVMSMRTFWKRLPADQFFSGWIAEAIEKGFSCSHCGDCEERCPYHLPIQDIMTENLEWYEREKSRSGY
jgi:predicted aldo/keto reductase-like oxidoreductase